MNGRTYILALVAVVFVNHGPVKAVADQSGLTKEQQERLQLFEAGLKAVPARPESPEALLSGAENGLRALLSLTNRPAPGPTNKLARSLVWGINGGTISVPQSVGLARELAKVMSQPSITSQDTYKFSAAIDPFIQATGLDNPSKMRLYREALRIVQTAPNYSYNQK